MRVVFAALVALAGETDAPAPRASPHFRQKLASAGLAVPQEEQPTSTFAPHFMQNSASGGLSWLHFAQSIAVYAAKSSGSARHYGFTVSPRCLR